MPPMIMIYFDDIITILVPEKERHRNGGNFRIPTRIRFNSNSDSGKGEKPFVY